MGTGIAAVAWIPVIVIGFVFWGFGALPPLLAVAGLATGAISWVVQAVLTLAVPDYAARHGAPAAARAHDGVLEPYFQNALREDEAAHWRSCRAGSETLARRLTDTPWKLLLGIWPVTLAYGTWLVSAGAVLFTAAALHSAVAFTLAGLWRGLRLAATGPLRFLHRRLTVRRGGRTTCGDRRCLRSFARPRYRRADASDTDGGLDRYPSASGVVWVRDTARRLHLTLPFWDDEAVAVCPACGRELGTGAGRERQALILVTGPSTTDSSTAARDGLDALWDNARTLGGPDRRVLLAGAARALDPGHRTGHEQELSGRIAAMRIAAGPTRRALRLLCATADARDLDSVEAGDGLPLFDDCQGVAFVVPADADWSEARQKLNVLRQRLALHRNDTRRVRVAVLALGGEPGDKHWEAMKTSLDLDFLEHRLFTGDTAADAAEPWRWLAGLEHIRTEDRIR